MSDQEPFTSYEEAWNYVYEDPEFKFKADEWFSQNFPDGHDSLIGHIALVELAHMRSGFALQPSMPGKCVFHPDALELLLKQGRHYRSTPELSPKFRTFPRQPLAGECFGNSQVWMRNVNKGARRHKDTNRLCYVEGMVCGYLASPMLHAWNTYSLTDDRAIDWSMYIGCEWNRYLGIAFSEAEYNELQTSVFGKDKSAPISLFDQELYPLVSDLIAELFAARETPADSS
jgi:hypothetical protein